MAMSTPELLGIEVQGAVVILSVRSTDGREVHMRWGAREPYNPRAWSWVRNQAAHLTASSPSGFLEVVEHGGKSFRFAVPSDDLIAQYQERMRRPVA